MVTGFVSGTIYNPGDTASHSYMVRAVHDACGTNSFPWAYTDTNQTPPPVGTLYMESWLGDLFIYWTVIQPAGVADSYQVMRSLTPDGSFDQLVGTATGNLHGIYIDMDAEPPVAYYKVRAVKGACIGPLD